MVLHKGQNPIEKIQLANSQKSSMVRFTISHESGLRSFIDPKPVKW